MASCCICTCLQPSNAPGTCILPGEAPGQSEASSARAGKHSSCSFCWYVLHLHQEALLTQLWRKRLCTMQTAVRAFINDKLAPARCPPSLSTRTRPLWTMRRHIGLLLPDWYVSEFVSFHASFIQCQGREMTSDLAWSLPVESWLVNIFFKEFVRAEQVHTGAVIENIWGVRMGQFGSKEMVHRFFHQTAVSAVSTVFWANKFAQCILTC